MFSMAVEAFASCKPMVLISISGLGSRNTLLLTEASARDALTNFFKMSGSSSSALGIGRSGRSLKGLFLSYFVIHASIFKMKCEHVRNLESKAGHKQVTCPYF